MKINSLAKKAPGRTWTNSLPLANLTGIPADRWRCAQLTPKTGLGEEAPAGSAFHQCMLK